MIAVELLRFVRHGVTPLVILAVERGWIPAAAESDLIEFAAIAISFLLAYGWSIRNELVSRRAAMGIQDTAGPVASGRADADRGD